MQAMLEPVAEKRAAVGFACIRQTSQPELALRQVHQGQWPGLRRKSWSCSGRTRRISLTTTTWHRRLRCCRTTRPCRLILRDTILRYLRWHLSWQSLLSSLTFFLSIRSYYFFKICIKGNCLMTKNHEDSAENQVSYCRHDIVSP